MEESLLGLFRLRARSQFGVRARDRTAALIEPPLGVESNTLAARLAHASGLYRAETIDCRQPPDRIADELEHADADVIVGYPSALALVAPQVAQRRSRIRPRLVYAGGEALSNATRRRIEEGFDARLFDIYGAHECNVLAWECPELGHLHVCDDNVILEVLRDGAAVGEGERGGVVVTSLHSYTMPFIRYSLGDVAVRGPDPCPCGQPFSTLRSVEGCLADYFHLPGGATVHPFSVTGQLLLQDSTWIDQHQMVQEAPDRVVLRLAPIRDPLPSELDRLQGLGEAILGAETRFEIELVERFPSSLGGKFQSYRSL